MNIGAVFLTGINHVIKDCQEDDVILIVESDQTSDPQLFSQMIEKITLEKNDICIASRYIDNGKYLNFPFMRLVYRKTVNHMLRIFFPLKNVTGYTIFFRSYRAKLLMRLLTSFAPTASYRARVLSPLQKS